MRWYSDKVRDNIDVRQAVQDAGKMGDAVAYAAQGFKNYADTVYAKKRAKIADAQKADSNSTKRYVADKGYKGKVESAKITSSAKIRAAELALKGKKIDFDKERYKSDKAYRKAIDSRVLEIKKQKIANSGKIGAAKIKAGAQLGAAKLKSGATRYKADRDVEGKRISGEKQLEVAKINAGAKKRKKQPRLKLDSDMTYKEVEEKLAKKKDFVL